MRFNCGRFLRKPPADHRPRRNRAETTRGSAVLQRRKVTFPLAIRARAGLRRKVAPPILRPRSGPREGLARKGHSTRRRITAGAPPARSSNDRAVLRQGARPDRRSPLGQTASAEPSGNSRRLSIAGDGLSTTTQRAPRRARSAASMRRPSRAGVSSVALRCGVHQ
jgi:hypothetical protein